MFPHGNVAIAVTKCYKIFQKNPNVSTSNIENQFFITIFTTVTKY